MRFMNKNRLAMSSGDVSPLVKQGSRLGPVFSTKDQCAFVKVSNDDKKRAVVNMTSMTLVDYVDRDEYPEGPLCSDQSLFVPIFCKECYGTIEDDYTEALASIVLDGSDKYLVGVCGVFGVSPDEVYPESRKEFIVDNDISYCGACHPQPGKAVFLHKAKKDIGRVKCYWHVHSRSVDKTFLYCCVACADNDYTNGVTVSEISNGFSLGTVGNNKIGPMTEECSLVPVPMRPGCFCTLVTSEDVRRTMTRMGFSAIKDSVLDAGIDLTAGDSVPTAQMETISDALDDSYESRSITETLKSLRVAILDQAAELQVLKDVIEAFKVQNSVLTQRLNCPDEPDTLFTVKGAKDFTRRTGVKTKLCAGVTHTDEDTNGGPTYPTANTSSPKRKQMEDTMDVNPTQIDNLIKLLQQQLQQQQVPSPQSVLPQQQSQAQLQALQSFMSLIPTLQQLTQPHHPWNNQLYLGEGTRGGQAKYNPNSVVNTSDTSFHHGTLSEEQKRLIAMEYNKQESERQAVSKKEQEMMIDSIKSSIRDVLLEQQGSSVSQDFSSAQSDMETLRSLARDTPYKRVRKQPKDDLDSRDISRLMNELRDMTKSISSRDRDGSSVEDLEAVRMDTDIVGEIIPSPSNDQQSSTVVMKKQQAGYTLPSSEDSPPETSSALADFISAVALRRHGST